MPFKRRVLLAAVLSLIAAAPAAAQLNPSRNITLVVPIAAGGGVDAIGRLVAEKLQERLKQNVVVENRTGAGGTVGTDSVAKAAPDGHTLLLMESSATISKWLNKGVPFDVTTDFAPIARVGHVAADAVRASFRRRQECQGRDRAGQVRAQLRWRSPASARRIISPTR